MRRPLCRARKRGSALVEFALTIVLACLLLLAGFEFIRLVLVYTDITSAARIGLRYAMTHGSQRTGTPGTPAGPATVTQIQNVARDYALGLLNTSDLQITVAYPDGSNDPNSAVEVEVTYQYQPWTLLPLAMPMRSITRGVITY